MRQPPLDLVLFTVPFGVVVQVGGTLLAMQVEEPWSKLAIVFSTAVVTLIYATRVGFRRGFAAGRADRVRAAGSSGTTA